MSEFLDKIETFFYYSYSEPLPPFGDGQVHSGGIILWLWDVFIPFVTSHPVLIVLLFAPVITGFVVSIFKRLKGA